jgi:hypothetical protein
MKITGRITKIYDIQQGTGKYGPWKRRDVLIEQETRFRTTLCVCIWDERLIRQELRVGRLMSFEIELSSRQFNNKWFTQSIVKEMMPFVTRASVTADICATKSETHLRTSRPAEWDDDFQEDDYSRQELDDMYKAAFENDAQWEWNID